jgi:hypothetical protein
VGSATVSGVNFDLGLRVTPPSTPTPPASGPAASEPLPLPWFEQWLNDIEATYAQAQTLADQFWSDKMPFVERWLAFVTQWLGDIEVASSRVETV